MGEELTKDEVVELVESLAEQKRKLEAIRDEWTPSWRDVADIVGRPTFLNPTFEGAGSDRTFIVPKGEDISFTVDFPPQEPARPTATYDRKTNTIKLGPGEITATEFQKILAGIGSGLLGLDVRIQPKAPESEPTLRVRARAIELPEDE